MNSKPRSLLAGLALAIILVTLTPACFGGAGAPTGWPGVAVENGTVYVGTREGKVLAIDAETRQRKWFFPSDAKSRIQGIYGTAAVAAEALYLGGYDTKVYAVNLQGGSSSWDPVKLEGRVIAEATLDGDMLYVAADDGRVYALDVTQNGKREWVFPKEGRVGKIWASPVVDGDLLYVVSFDHNLYALNKKTGEEVWRFRARGGLVSPPAVGDNLLYVGSVDRTMYAVRKSDQQVEWSRSARNWFWTTPLLVGDTLYAGSLDRKVYAWDAATGQPRWAQPFEADGPVKAPPLLVGSTLVIASEDGHLYFLDPATGSPKAASYNASFPIPTAIAEEAGTVYAVSQDGTLHALDAAGGSPKWTLGVTVK